MSFRHGEGYYRRSFTRHRGGKGSRHAPRTLTAAVLASLKQLSEHRFGVFVALTIVPLPGKCHVRRKPRS